MEFENYLNVMITLACLLVGFVCKMWMKDEDNKYIPTIVFVVGVILGFVMFGLNVESFVVGGISGIASTGFHQLFKQFVENR